MHRIKTIVDKARPLVSVAVRTLPQTEPKCQTLLNRILPLSRDFVRKYVAPVAAEPFLNGSSSVYVEEMYNSWIQDPNSVHKVSIVIYVYVERAVGDKQLLQH